MPQRGHTEDVKETTVIRTLLVSLFLLASPPMASATKLVPADKAQITLSYAPLVKRVAPAVVNVFAERQVQRRRMPFEGDPFFERFFGDRGFMRRQRPQSARSLGSGVVISPDGLIVTNNHVIAGMDRIRVALADGREFPAELKLADKRSDLAVLQIEADEELPIIPIGDSDGLEVGDLVLALGNPFGVGQTVTSGIVSALARNQRGTDDFGFFVQTDASINPGNSGGALVAMDGTLVGINTAIYSRSGGSNGIGFAVPSNMVRVVLNSVRSGSERIERPYIGARFQSVTADIAASLGMERPSGALVASVLPDSPAEAARLRPGDVILAVDGRALEHVDALGYRLATLGVAGAAELTVLSRNERRTVRVTLQRPPEEPKRDERTLEGRSPFAGIVAWNLSPATAQTLDMPVDARGVVIAKVEPRSPAARVRFQPRDVIEEINGEPITDTRALETVTSQRYRGWEFTIVRNGRRLQQYLR